MLQCEIPLEFGFDLLVQMALHKRTKLETLVGILYHHFNDAQITADMLKRAAEADLMDWDNQLRIFVVRFTIDAEVQTELDRFQFPLPMVVKPRTLTSNRDTGYILNGSGSSVILKKNHHEGDVSLDHLNRLNAMRFTINLDVAENVQNTWRSLSKPKPGETRDKWEKRKRTFDKYNRVAKNVIDTLMAHSDSFYFTHRYDKRGRTYCMGYHCTYQGNDWNKSCIEFADKEIVE
jgi:DNA-directed RNA polymerase